jgi:HSP20 family protein
MKKIPLSLVKREPASDLTPFEEFERRFDELLRSPFSMMRAPWWPRWAVPAEGISPTVDVFEEGADVVVKAEIPGMKKEDIHVDINEKTVTISGEKKKEEKVERKNYSRLERTYGSFARIFELPAEVQTEKARATFREGVLEVRMPKTEEAARRTRKVAIE